MSNVSKIEVEKEMVQSAITNLYEKYKQMNEKLPVGDIEKIQIILPKERLRCSARVIVKLEIYGSAVLYPL